MCKCIGSNVLNYFFRVYLKAALPHDITNVGQNRKTLRLTKENFPDTGIVVMTLTHL